MLKWICSRNGILAEIVVLMLVLGIYGISRTENAEAVYGETVTGQEAEEEKDYIKWVEFRVTAEAMRRAYEYDVESYGEEKHVSWIDLLAYLGAKYGGDFSRYKSADMDKMAEEVLEDEEES